MSQDRSTTPPPTSGSTGEVFAVFGKLGFTSFGGPVAHLGYFRDAFVTRLKWLSDKAYADLVALCQFLPGPASSQVGMALGYQRAGMSGLMAAWATFTLPSAVLLVAFAYGVSAIGDVSNSGVVAGLKAAAVAVVVHAVIGMARNLTPDLKRAAIAVIAAVVMLLVSSPFAQVGVIVLGGLIGWAFLRAEKKSEAERSWPVRLRRRTGAILLAIFGVLLVALPILTALTGNGVVRLIDIFYRAGALVFGGGHVVLPLLESEVVGPGLVDHDVFLAGYGAAQAVPGPLFAFAAYLGASTVEGPSGILGATIALLAIFLPAGLLVIGALPFWNTLRHSPVAQRALMGINAAVVGILAAAAYDPVFTQGVTSWANGAIALVAFLALQFAKVPAWAVVIGAGGVGLAVL